MEEYIATGRRKTSVASVRLRPGNGKVNVNGYEALDKYFNTPWQIKYALSALAKLGLEGKYDLIIRAKGGGIDGQAAAVRLGIARALVKQSEERRNELKNLGYLTRDARRKERKKYGQPGARKRFQFSKR
jgi:small subunit ribosomal protein S9